MSLPFLTLAQQGPAGIFSCHRNSENGQPQCSGTCGEVVLQFCSEISFSELEGPCCAGWVKLSAEQLSGRHGMPLQCQCCWNVLSSSDVLLRSWESSYQTPAFIHLQSTLENTLQQ